MISYEDWKNQRGKGDELLDSFLEEHWDLYIKHCQKKYKEEIK